MGMFDYLRCAYPLPAKGANELSYQTKDLDCGLDVYEIREDGTLWHEDYDVEDHSDPNEEGLMRLCGMLSRVNKKWNRVEYTGEVRFYTSWLDNPSRGWIEWSSYFVNGQLKELHLMTHELP
jgi:hypothetical protein